MRRRIKLFAIGVSIGFIIVVIGISIFSYLYRDKLAGFLLIEIKKHVKTKVEIGKINFTILKKFPQASLELKDVLIYPTDKYEFEKPYNHDTLLFAKKIYLQFNIIHLLKNQFILSKIHVDQASLNLQINKKGQYNFDIVRKNGKNGESISVDLRDVKCSRTDIRFYNETKKLRVHCESYNSRIKGNLSSTNYTISSISELYVHTIKSEDITFLKNKPAELNIELHVNDNKFHISKGEIKIQGQFFGLNGEIDARKTILLDLNLEGTKLNIDDLMASFPDSIRKKIDMDLSGELFFQAHVKGPWSITKYPHVTSSFGIHNGELTRNGISVSNIKFEGKYNNGKDNSLESSSLSLDPVSFNIENEKVQCKIKIQNLKLPKALIRFSAAFELQHLKRLFKIPSLSDEEGSLSANIQAALEMTDSNNLSINKIYISHIQGTIGLNKLGFRWKESKKRFSDITGQIEIDQQVALKNISAKIANNDLLMNLSINNFFEYINHKDTLYITGNLKSDYLNYDEISSALTGTSKGSAFALPDSVAMDLNWSVGSLKWKNFICHSLETHVIYQPKNFVFQPVLLTTMSGSIAGNIAFGTRNKNDIGLDVEANLKNIDISKMFESFSNFGQVVLQDKHLKGHVDGKVSFHSLWNNQFELYNEKIKCEADIEIKKGELIDFPPMLALSKYVDVSELKHVRFATLKNSVYIQDNVVHIPTMDISSNALDISLSGTHNFKNEYDYHITLSLADILWKKSNKKDQFGEVEEDKGRMKAYLLIKGQGNAYEVSLDRRKSREEFAKHLTREKQTVRTILHEELGWFKKDTAIKVIPDRTTKKVKVTWEEAESNLTRETLKDTVKKTKVILDNKPRVEWQDE